MSKYVRKREQTYRRMRGLNLTLVAGPPLVGHEVQWDERYHTLSIDQTLILCTPTEFRLLKLLLEQSEHGVSSQHLIAQFDHAAFEDLTCARDAKKKLTRLMCSIRAKLWVCNLDVVSMMGYGYMLLNYATRSESAPG